MIYEYPDFTVPIDQGDIIRDCPVVSVSHFDGKTATEPDVEFSLARVVVLTQTCDLAQKKVGRAVVTIAHSADELIRAGRLKASEVRGPVRGGRVYGWYFLPADASVNIPELVIDLRELHTVRLEILEDLCVVGLRQARVRPLYREHLAKHFGDTYSRIGLPEPYPTE